MMYPLQLSVLLRPMLLPKPIQGILVSRFVVHLQSLSSQCRLGAPMGLAPVAHVLYSRYVLNEQTERALSQITALVS